MWGDKTVDVDIFQPNGQKKVRMVPGLDVFLTPAQLSQAMLKAGTNPRLLIGALLEVFFSKEVLAVSSAKGKRPAYNNKTGETSMALPESVVSAIKQYTLIQFKKPSGEPCLSESAMNDIINTKCATARRSLNSKRNQIC